MIFNVNILSRLCPELKLFCRGPNFEHATLSLNDQQQFAQSDNCPEAPLINAAKYFVGRYITTETVW